MKKNEIVYLIIGIILILGISTYIIITFGDKSENEFPSDAVCNDIYLGFCYNQSSPAFSCNMETKTCNDYEFKLATLIGLMEQENIKIYGTTTCPVCKKQLKDFSPHEDYLIQRGIFIYCDVEPMDPGCSDVVSVPTWKQNNEIGNIGYIEIKQTILDLNITAEV